MQEEPIDQRFMDFIRQESHNTGMDGYTVYQLVQNYWYFPQRVILPARTNPADLEALMDRVDRNPRWVFVPAGQ